MKRKHYTICTKRHVAIALGLLLSAAALLTMLAVAVPNALAVATATTERKIPIYCTDRGDKVVSLTFDAAWGDEDTPTLIEIFKKYDISVTFFVVGEWAERCSDSVKALKEAGHEVMNHSSSHPHMPQLSREGMVQEIQEANEKIAALTGETPILFRAPYGDYNNALIETVDSLGMYCVQWDVDSLDWKDPPVEDIVKRVTGRVKSGSIVLFHNAAKNTPAALPAIIEKLQADGYAFLKASEMIYHEDYTINHEGRQIAKQPAPAPDTTAALPPESTAPCT